MELNQTTVTVTKQQKPTPQQQQKLCVCTGVHDPSTRNTDTGHLPVTETVLGW